MLKELKRQLYLNRMNFVIGLIVVCSGGVFVSILANIVAAQDVSMNATEAVTLPRIGSLVGMAIGLFYSVILGLANVPMTGDMSLKFGAVRRQFFPAMILLNIFTAAFCVLVAKALVLVDLLAAAISKVPVMPFSIPWYWQALACVAAGLFSTWVGTLLLRYGKKAFWVVFAVYMVAILFGSRIIHFISEGGGGMLGSAVRTVFDVWATLPVPGLALLGLLLALAVTAHIWVMGRRAAAI